MRNLFLYLILIYNYQEGWLIKKYILLFTIVCLLFSAVPTIADSTMIEDESYGDLLDLNRKMTPLLMSKVMDYDDLDEISVIIQFKDNGKLVDTKASVKNSIKDIGGKEGFDLKTIKGV